MKERGVWREAQVCVTGKRRKQLSDEHRLLWLFDIGLSAVSFLCGGNTVIKQGGQQGALGQDECAGDTGDGRQRNTGGCKPHRRPNGAG
ncbi:hypothetical protein FQA47_010975 [Oryzias melastigma]|uniref:Uncharacterized protein n=1 Tax=Oryzias melastigma TaxID=30732 RepID=A0A834C163_ORYME|nr:hypothetical protein FQA47_010975 [Oryzias melastigma]